MSEQHVSPRINRRRFLTAAAAVTATGLAGRVLPAPAEEAAPVTLIAGRRTLDINGRAAGVYGITQPDGTAGLTMQAGARFRAVVRNDCGADTLIHWHGLMPPAAQDGVPGLSGPAIAPGGTARYDFPLAFGGTYWMHSHQGFQQQALMAAPLIIHERGEPADRQEVVLLLQDFSFKAPEEIFAGLRKPMPKMAAMDMPHMDMAMPMAAMKPDLNDIVHDALLANDRTLADPKIVRVERGGRVLLRIVNAAASSAFRIDLGPVRATLEAVDGHRVAPMSGSSFPIAMGQRLDLALQIPPEHPVVPVLATLEGETRRTGLILAAAGAAIAKLPEQGNMPAPALDLTLERKLRAAAPLPSKPADRTLQLALTGSMAGYEWGLNGHAYGEDSPLTVAQGERVELVMTNRTMMAHPMHLHGHVFQVVAIDEHRFAGARRDTVLVPPQHSVTVAFDAVNPGRWALHCHNLYHMAAGMMTTLRYAEA